MAPLGAEELPFTQSPRGRSPLTLWAFTTQSLHMLRLHLLRKSDAPFPSLWIEDPRTGVESHRQHPKTFHPDPRGCT